MNTKVEHSQTATPATESSAQAIMPWTLPMTAGPYPIWGGEGTELDGTVQEAHKELRW